MVFKSCKYCGLFEMDESTLFSKLNKKGTLTFFNIHIKCKEEKETKLKEEKETKKIEKNNLKKQRKKTIVDNIINTPEKKMCVKCEIPKHISEFYTNRNFTHNSYCKECTKKCVIKSKNENIEKVKEYQKIYIKKYYEENKDKAKEYREKNKEHYKKYGNEYYKKNKNKIKELSKKYYENNRNIIIERSKLYYKKNKINNEQTGK